MSATKSLRRLARLEDFFVGNDNSVEGGRQGPVELDPCLLYGYSDEEDDVEIGDVDVMRKGGLGLLDVDMMEPADRIGTTVYALHDHGVDAIGRLADVGSTGRKEYPPIRKGHVSERLLAQHGRKREKDVKRWEEEYEREFREHCTFAPSVMQDAVKARLQRDSVLYNMPVEKRLSMEWRRKEERLLDARRRADGDATFQPRINSLSRQIAEKRRERMRHGSIHTMEEPASCHDENVQKVFTTQQSEDILQSSGSIPRDFQDRQDYFLSKYQRNQSMMLRTRDDGEGREFKANIPADILVSSNRLVEQMLETREERLERMAHGDAAAIEARRMKRKQEMDAQFRYRPDLNKKSLEMASSGIGKVGDARQKRVQEYKDGQDRECTFRPDTSKPYVHGFYCEYMAPGGDSKYSISKALREGSIDTFLNNIAQDRQEKAREAEEERLAKELEECSFKPNVNTKIVKSASFETPLHLMPGMQGFYHKLELIEKKQAELAEREKACFVQADHWTPAPTVVQPFNLSYTRIL